MSVNDNKLQEAITLHSRYRNYDPIPDIASALLNKEDIKRYVRKTGMLCPFHSDDEKSFKPASYALKLMGPCVYWNEEGEIVRSDIEKGEVFQLKRDSIAFVSLEPYIMLPTYIAARFNLKIDYVYKGLLLGTGPLVDPGFVGRLSFPLHNLTSRDYILIGGEDLVWMEFTKLSCHEQWKNEGSNNLLIENKKFSKKLDKIKKNYDMNQFPGVHEYLAEGTDGPVESSIPKSVTKSAEAAESAEKSARTFQIIAVISIVVALVAISFQVFNFYKNATDVVKESREYIERSNERMAGIEERVESIEQSVEDIREETQ